MNIKIGRKIYNTETATLVCETAQGAYGDSQGFSEKLYKRGPQDYFIFGHGGDQSPYPQPGLFVLSIEDAKAWLIRVAGEEFANTELGIAKATTRTKKAAVETVPEAVAVEDKPAAKKTSSKKAAKADGEVKAEKVKKTSVKKTSKAKAE
jgi:hypothetical protein